MRFEISQLVVALVLPGLSLALPSQTFESRADLPYHLRGKRSYVERDGVKRTIFEHEATGATIDFVTNSGICETTPGVNQYSGYLSVGSKSPFRTPELLLLTSLKPTKICGSGFSKLETTPPQLLWRPGSMVDQAAHR